MPRHIVLLLGCGVAAVPSRVNAGTPREAALPAIGMRGLEWAMNTCGTKVPTTLCLGRGDPIGCTSRIRRTLRRA